MTGKAIVRVAVVGVMLAVAATALWTWFDAARERARMSACQSNLSLLASSMAMYAQDWDGHMPPKPKEGDFMVRRWEAPSEREMGGPLSPYCKNLSISACPSDPYNWKRSGMAGWRSSYEWNLELYGKRYKEVMGKPLVWDKGAWHRLKRGGPAGRNVAFVAPADRKGAVRWFEESEFQAIPK